MVIKRLFLILTGLFFISSSALYLFLSKEELISYIVAFLTSTVVVLATFKNYKDMVENRLALNDGIGEVDDRDVIDKIDDPYNIYYEDKEDKKEVVEDLKEAIKQERELMKKSRRPLKESAKDTVKAFSFIRLIAYAFFIGGFFYLLSNNYLVLYTYLPTLIFPNLISIIYLLNIKK